ncbi:MAG TPA: hypothetical protein VE779_13925, partial [Candidatus Angelobacter sp.]|nr:hypothetical protein [Candidatus Angelobacter sp.]
AAERSVSLGSYGYLRQVLFASSLFGVGGNDPLNLRPMTRAGCQVVARADYDTTSKIASF